jgi:hypothetical protein
MNLNTSENNEQLRDRLNRVLPRLQSGDLLNNKGLGNEIGFYIFDYPPEQELEVDAFLKDVILPSLDKGPTPVRARHVNLFQLVLDVLNKRDLLDRAVAIQVNKGDKEVLRAMKGPLEPAKLAQELVKDIDLSQTDLVLLTGVGSAYPMLRTNTLLSALHPLMGHIPLVAFYPGTYDGTKLRLFNRLRDDNYYRAFRLAV